MGPALPGLTRYAELLAGPGVDWGLLGPREVPRLWERHLLNCAAVAELVPEGATLADVGSGAGLPGIVLALVRPDVTVTLIEPLQRRTAFLELAVDRLGLSGVRVLRARAESSQARSAGPFDVVTARAVAPLDRLVGWCLPLVREGGLLVALKGEQAAAELAKARPLLRNAGGENAVVQTIPALAPRVETIVVTIRRSARRVAASRGRGGAR